MSILFINQSPYSAWRARRQCKIVVLQVISIRGRFGYSLCHKMILGCLQTKNKPFIHPATLGEGRLKLTLNRFAHTIRAPARPIPFRRRGGGVWSKVLHEVRGTLAEHNLAPRSGAGKGRAQGEREIKVVSVAVLPVAERAGCSIGAAWM